MLTLCCFFYMLVKAGGMRIVQHKHGNEPKPEQPTKEDEEEFGTR